MQHKPHIICESQIDDQFERAIMVTIRMPNGAYMDFLFDSAGVPIVLGTHHHRIVSGYFNKSFSNINFLNELETRNKAA